jgi:DNA polymerase
MTDIRAEFLDIVTQIRTHLEYQKSLGVRHMEMACARPAPAGAVDRAKAAGHEAGTHWFTEEGDPGAAILFIGALTGQGRERGGRLYAGPADQLLTDIIVKGMKLRREEVSICGIDPSPQPDKGGPWEPALRARLRACKPRVIVALGEAAAQALLRTPQAFTALRGTWHEFDGIPLMPTYDPQHLIGNAQDKKPAWEDIKKVMGKL